mmetsp:Transcript_875/g.1813  ORF Transcript_875/g.1813 Transcript_875/m.1813 type:complete len:235 (-) Transcript_875:466-1170(-)
MELAPASWRACLGSGRVEPGESEQKARHLSSLARRWHPTLAILSVQRGASSARSTAATGCTGCAASFVNWAVRPRAPSLAILRARSAAFLLASAASSSCAASRCSLAASRSASLALADAREAAFSSSSASANFSLSTASSCWITFFLASASAFFACSTVMPICTTSAARRLTARVLSPGARCLWWSFFISAVRCLAVSTSFLSSSRTAPFSLSFRSVEIASSIFACSFRRLVAS